MNADVIKSDWARRQEVGTRAGIKLLFWIYAVVGRRALDIILLAVVGYYYLSQRQTRLISRSFLSRYQQLAISRGRVLQSVSVYRHFYNFASSMLDKTAVWCGHITLTDINFPAHDELTVLAEKKQGAIFISSHFGNIEICRCLVRKFPQIKVNAVVYSENAQKFNSLLRDLDVSAGMNIISAAEINISTAILLKEKIDNGEWIFIMGDRLSVNSPERTLEGRFMGASVDLPLGPFALADLLKQPIFSMHCYRQGSRFDIRVIPIENRVDLVGDRLQRLGKIAQVYLTELEELVLMSPLQWFNFYDFWQRKN